MVRAVDSAPEVVKFQLCDASSDIWRVGIFMYIIVGGYLPFRGRYLR